MHRSIKRFIIGMVITIIVCVAFSSFVGAVEFYPDNSELQFHLFERIMFVEDKLNQTGNDWTEEYTLTLKTAARYANEVYEKRNAEDIEINNAITAINLALDGKLKYSDINDYFDLINKETQATESPAVLPTAPTTVPTQEPTSAPTILPSLEPTETPSANPNTELIFYPDNSDLQIELYVAISTVDEMLSSTTGLTWTKEYIQITREARDKAFEVYNNRSTSSEQISNAIQVIRLAIDGKLTREDINRYFGGSSNPTEIHNKIGDADGDDVITILDVTYIQRSEIGITLPTPIVEDAADVDGDGYVSIIDATLIQRYLVGIPTVYNIGEYL